MTATSSLGQTASDSSIKKVPNPEDRKISAWSDLLGKMHEIDPLTAKLIFLSLMSGVVDPRVKVAIPSMGFFPLTLPIVIADMNPKIQRAVRYASLSFSKNISFITDDFFGKSPGALNTEVVRREEVAKFHFAQVDKLRKELEESVGRDPFTKSQMEEKMQQNVDALRSALLDLEKAHLGCRPGILVNQLTSNLALEPHVHAYDGKIFSLSPDGEAVQGFLLSAPREQRLLLSYLLAGYFGGSWNWEHHRNKEAQVGFLWMAPRADVDILISSVAKQSYSMLSNLVVCFPEERSTSTTGQKDNLESLGWRDFIESHLKMRLTADETPVQINWSPDALRVFKKICKAYRDKSINFPPFQRNVCLSVPELLGKLSALLQQSAPPHDWLVITESTVCEAIKIVESIVDQRLAYHGQAHQEAEDREFQTVIERIIERGPIKKRELLRSFHRPDSHKIDRILKRAEEKGIIKIVDRKLQVESCVGAVGASAG